MRRSVIKCAGGTFLTQDCKMRENFAKREKTQSVFNIRPQVRIQTKKVL